MGSVVMRSLWSMPPLVLILLCLEIAASYPNPQPGLKIVAEVATANPIEARQKDSLECPNHPDCCSWPTPQPKCCPIPARCTGLEWQTKWQTQSDFLAIL